MHDESSTPPASEPEVSPTAPKKTRRPSDPVVHTGRYLVRCVHPGASIHNLCHIAEDSEGDPETSHLDEATYREYQNIFSKLVAYHPQLKVKVLRDIDGVKSSLKYGMRAARSDDANKIKKLAGSLASTTSTPIPLCHVSKSERGFNHDELGRLLIPIDYLEAYDDDPVGVREAVNAGDPSYQVTAENPPAYLYEDTTEYDPNFVLRGLMRGPFLVRCFLALYWSPTRALVRDSSGRSTKPSATCLNQKYGLRTVTAPMIIYAAIQARFAISSQQTWTGRDAIFDYDEYADVLFSMFTLNKKWTEDTLNWWNCLIFGRENGLTVTSRRVPGVSLFAKAKAQLARIAAEQAAADEAAAEEAAAEEAAAEEAAAEEAAEEAARERAYADLPDLTDDEREDDGLTPPDGSAAAMRTRDDGDEEDDSDRDVIPARQSRKRGIDALAGGVRNDNADGVLQPSNARATKKQKSASSGKGVSRRRQRQ